MPCANHPEVLEGLNSCTRCAKKFCGDCLVEIKGGSFCAGCKSEEVKDIQSGVGASKELVPAGIGRRFAAQFVDGLLFGLIWLVFAFTMGFFNARSVEEVRSKMLLLQVIFFFGSLAYEGIMLQMRGQTLGKMALGIKVVSPDGRPLAPWQAWVRPLVRTGIATVTGIVATTTGTTGTQYLAFVDYLPALFTKQKTCIHDLAAKTRVVRV